MEDCFFQRFQISIFPYKSWVKEVQQKYYLLDKKQVKYIMQQNVCRNRNP